MAKTPPQKCEDCGATGGAHMPNCPAMRSARQACEVCGAEGGAHMPNCDELLGPIGDAERALLSHLESAPIGSTAGNIGNMREGYTRANYFVIYSDADRHVRSLTRGVLRNRGYTELEEGAEEYAQGDERAEIWVRSHRAKKIADQDRRDYARCEGRWDGQGKNPWGAKYGPRTVRRYVRQRLI